MKMMTFWGRNDQDENLLIECLQGVKTVTCTPKVWVTEEDYSYVGDLFEVQTKLGKKACVIEITEVYEMKFGDITGEIGERIAKGENSTLEQFIQDHIFSWEAALEQEGHGFNEETLIVVEHFTVVERWIEAEAISPFYP